MRIAVEQLTKRFEGTLVLDRVDLEIGEREFLGLLGPSGSGKTTLLRILAGLEFADTGRVLFDGAEAQALPIAERQVGMVFQHYALFGHMTVFNNVAFGLKVRPRPSRPPRNEIAERVERLLHSSSSTASAIASRDSSRAGSASASRLPAPSRRS